MIGNMEPSSFIMLDQLSFMLSRDYKGKSLIFIFDEYDQFRVKLITSKVNG